MTTSLDPEGFIYVENLDDKPYEYYYQQRKAVLPPGRQVPIPWAHMIRIAGDPFSSDTNPRNPRSAQVERLRNFHGIYGDEARWERRPRLKFTDEHDNLISTPLWDPTGLGDTPSTDPTDTQFILARLEQNEKENRRLREMFEASERERAALAGDTTRADVPVPVASEAAPPTVDTGRIDDPASPTPKPAKPGTEAPVPGPEDVTEDKPNRVKVT